MERTGVITFKGNGLTLVGPALKVGDAAPDCTVVDNTLSPVSLSSFKGQVVIISAVPSLDTPVCEVQTQRFNKEAAALNAKVLSISMDLPFAQKRFCGAHGIAGIAVLSDYKDRDFAHKFGVYIKELGLITRSVFVLDKDSKLTYQQIVAEVTEHPDYYQGLAAAKQAGA